MANASKGGEFEREICKYLSKWIQGTEKPYIFWRGRGSGGMFTMDEGTGGDFSGDIYLIRPEGKFFADAFATECKNGYPKTSIDYHLKYNKSDGIKEFWEQCCEAASKTNRNPLLIYRKKGIKPVYVGIDEHVFKKLFVFLKEQRFIHLSYPDTDLSDLYLFGQSDFFDNITPKMVEKTLC